MGKARDFIPALKFGHKIYPEDLAGMLGLPSIGNILYVDPGKSSSGGGRSRADAFATVAEALDAATADQDDVILITPSSSTGRTVEAAAIDWNKRRTHLIGSTSPLTSSPRAGMSFGSATGTPSMTISARSCIFKNITIAQFNDVNVLLEMTASYNYFEGVHFAGIGHADTGDDNAARVIVFNGAEENTFNGCMFGLDTVTRTGTNYTLEFKTGVGNPRNIFRGCLFTLFADADAPRHVLVGNGGADRYELFDNCIFMDHSDMAAATLQSDVFETSTVSDQGGILIVKDCMNVSSTGWASTVAGVRIIGQDTNATTLTNYASGVNPAA